MDEVEHLRLTDLNKSIYKKRKQTIERIFADAKEKHGMRWTKYRGLEKVATHTMLVFAAMNLKKLATWLWKGKEPLFFCSKIRNEVDKSCSKLELRVWNSFCLQSGKSTFTLLFL